MLVKSSQQRACMVDIVGNLAYISGVQNKPLFRVLYFTYFSLPFLGELKSVNLQYNTLVRLDTRTKDSSTKRLMFQALLFFHYFL